MFEKVGPNITHYNRKDKNRNGVKKVVRGLNYALQYFDHGVMLCLLNRGLRFSVDPPAFSPSWVRVSP